MEDQLACIIIVMLLVYIEVFKPRPQQGCQDLKVVLFTQFLPTSGSVVNRFLVIHVTIDVKS